MSDIFFLRVLRALRGKRFFFICKLQFHHEGHEEHEDETFKDLPLFLHNGALS
jgi:hypothetical protein